MNLAQFLFYAFSSLAVASAVVILLTKKILYAALALMLTLFSVAAIYVFARADLLAVTQIIVYVGGILVLIIFAVMLTSQISGKPLVTESHHRLAGFLLAASLLSVLLLSIFQMNFEARDWMDHRGIQGSTVESFGIKLMSDSLLPFEIAAVLLLISLLGAVYIARPKKKKT